MLKFKGVSTASGWAQEVNDRLKVLNSTKMQKLQLNQNNQLCIPRYPSTHEKLLKINNKTKITK